MDDTVLKSSFKSATLQCRRIIAFRKMHPIKTCLLTRDSPQTDHVIESVKTTSI